MSTPELSKVKSLVEQKRYYEARTSENHRPSHGQGMAGEA